MLKTNNDIDFYSCNGDLLLQVVTQMEKDIALSGMSYSFSSTTSKDLIEELEIFLTKSNNSRAMQNLFYSADVKTFEHSENLSVQHSISRTLWNRVFLKVWTRINYSA